MTAVPAKTHAALGASSAHRWMQCPGSLRLSQGLSGVESEHSRAGTAAHAVAEMALTRGVDPDMWLGLTVEGVEVDDEMVEAVRVFVDYCRSLMKPELINQPQHWIEHKFSLAALNPPAPMFGTADFVAYNPEMQALEVVDFKYGSGVVVEVKGNKQLRYYALGAALTLNDGRPIQDVAMTIVQPRAAHPDGQIRSETVPLLALLDFSGELLAAARATLAPDAPLVAGSHCRWCLAAPTCPAQRDQVQALAQVAFDAMPLDVPPPPEGLPPAVFADILSKLPILEDWSKAMRAEALRRLERGEDVPGHKLVAKRATRKWISETDAVTMLGDVMMYVDEELYEKKLKSPAQIEKLTGKKNFPSQLVESKSSGYTLAPAADKRPALSPSASDAFSALPAGNE